MPESTFISFSGKPTTRTFADAVVLQKVEVIFMMMPNGDNKDDDTKLSLSVVRPDGVTVVATHPDIAPGKPMQASLNTEFGPYPLILSLPVDQTSYSECYASVEIRPNGNDRVIWNVIVRAFFSNNSIMTSQSGYIIQDQNVPTHNWPIA